ncbi:MAG: hypothetical protein LBF19_04825 [Prevotellaceae bacterium]|nr:hypothetical protein [Prevotellaceae bacterium]
MTKVQKILLLTICLLFCTACGKEETDSPLPFVTVDVMFNLNVPPYNIPLQLWPAAMKMPQQYIGYNGNGLFLVRQSEDYFQAYDATCTRNINHHIAALQLDDFDIIAHCPHTGCGAQYNLISGGYETAGQFRLQEYRVTYNPGAKTGRITNR